MDELGGKDLQETLTGEMLFLQLMGKLWITYPNSENKEWFFSLLDKELFSEAPFANAQRDVQEGMRLIREWIDENQSLSKDDLLLELQSDYSGLFICANKITAPPWESVYRSKERLVMQDDTLKIRKFYRKYGLVLEHDHTEPDDHIGYELLFAAFLTQKMLQASEAGDSSAFQKYREGRLTFLSEHLLQWSLLFCSRVDRYAKTKFYAGLSRLQRSISLELAENYGITLLLPDELGADVKPEMVYSK